MQLFWQRIAPSRLSPEGWAVFKLVWQSQAELAWLAVLYFWRPWKSKHSDFRVAYRHFCTASAIFCKLFIEHHMYFIKHFYSYSIFKGFCWFGNSINLMRRIIEDMKLPQLHIKCTINWICGCQITFDERQQNQQVERKAVKTKMHLIPLKDMCIQTTLDNFCIKSLRERILFAQEIENFNRSEELVRLKLNNKICNLWSTGSALYSFLSNKLRVANKRRVWKKYQNLMNEESGTNGGPQWSAFYWVGCH